MATDLTKYKRYNGNILENNHTVNSSNKKAGRKSQGLKNKVTINLNDNEFNYLKQLNEKTGTPITTMIRRALINSGLIKSLDT